LDGVIAEHDVINCEVGLLRQLVKKLTNTQEEDDFGGGEDASGKPKIYLFST
jgi:hypothetical protein